MAVIRLVGGPQAPTRTLPDDRPRSIPSMTRAHEFFGHALDPDDPVLESWRQHLIRTGTPFADDGCGMLYVHKRIAPKGMDDRYTSGRRRWCCDA